MTVVDLRTLLVVTVISVPLFLPRPAAAHCDTMDGPVVKAAEIALKTGNVTPVLRWVPKGDEGRIRVAFERTLKVRALSREAREFADNYFFETLVGIHRTGEGEPYTGLKPAGIAVEPEIALADKSLNTGSVDVLIEQAKTEVARDIRQRFSRVQETSKHANDSVEAGRQYVAAYVEFIHFVERIHQIGSEPTSHAQHEAQVTEAVPQRQP